MPTTTGADILSTPRLVIARNTGMRRTLCAMCNKRRDFTLGLELFRIDTMELVCWNCGQEHAPDLMALLSLGWMASSFAWEHKQAQDLSLAPLN